MNTFLMVLILVFAAAVFFVLVVYSLYLLQLGAAFYERRFLKFFSRLRKRGEERKMTKNISRDLIKFMKKNRIRYKVVRHPQAFTSSETAQVSHIPGKEFAKVVMVKAKGEERKGKEVMVVLPSDRTVDLLKLGETLKTSHLRIEEESDFKGWFYGCEVGAMPPFGPHYRIPCYIDESLLGTDKIYFNAGTHEACLQIPTDDFLRVVKGVVGDYSVLGKKIHEREKIAV